MRSGARSSIANQQCDRTCTALVCDVEKDSIELHPKRDMRVGAIVLVIFTAVN
jgi:hypothetical protein